jgi:hypothetical protein
MICHKDLRAIRQGRMPEDIHLQHQLRVQTNEKNSYFIKIIATAHSAPLPDARIYAKPDPGRQIWHTNSHSAQAPLLKTGELGFHTRLEFIRPVSYLRQPGNHRPYWTLDPLVLRLRLSPDLLLSDIFVKQ